MSPYEKAASQPAVPLLAADLRPAEKATGRCKRCHGVSELAIVVEHLDAVVLAIGDIDPRSLQYSFSWPLRLAASVERKTPEQRNEEETHASERQNRDRDRRSARDG